MKFYKIDESCNMHTHTFDTKSSNSLVDRIQSIFYMARRLAAVKIYMSYNALYSAVRGSQIETQELPYQSAPASHCTGISQAPASSGHGRSDISTHAYLGEKVVREKEYRSAIAAAVADGG